MERKDAIVSLRRSLIQIPIIAAITLGAVMASCTVSTPAIKQSPPDEQASAETSVKSAKGTSSLTEIPPQGEAHSTSEAKDPTETATSSGAPSSNAVQDEPELIPTTTHYTNEHMPVLLASEARQLKEEFISPLYPAPKPLPSKLNSVFLPLPEYWRKALLRVNELKAMGFNSVHFGPIMNIDQNDHPYSVGEDIVRFYINEFHRNGMHVLLTTNPAGPWADYGSEPRDDWPEQVRQRRYNGTFTDEYTEQIYAWARIAEELDVAAFIPSNEIHMISTNQTYLNQKAAEILPEIRKLYSGKVGFNIQKTGDLGEEGNWIPTSFEYNLTDYDFIICMGSIARICDTVTRDLCGHHIIRTNEATVKYLQNLALQYDIDDVWVGFELFNGEGTYWEPNNGNPYSALTPGEAAEYSDILLDTVYEDVSGISAAYYPGFMIFEEPLPYIWTKYLGEYNHLPQGEKKWQERELSMMEEYFFPEWDSLYSLPWGDKIMPEYRATLTSNEHIAISGTAIYEYPRKIQIRGFNFEGDGRDIEIRLADDRTERLLINIAHLMDIGNETYVDAELTLYWPDILQERMFNHLIIYDADNRQILGKYRFVPPPEGPD